MTTVGLQGLLTGKPWPHQVEGRLPVRLLRATLSTSRLGKACAWLPHAPGRLPFSRLSVSPSVRSCGRELDIDQYVGNVPVQQKQLFSNPKDVILIQKRHLYTGNLNSETSGDSKSAFSTLWQCFSEHKQGISLMGYLSFCV